jgi:hypothetical protein
MGEIDVSTGVVTLGTSETTFGGGGVTDIQGLDAEFINDLINPEIAIAWGETTGGNYAGKARGASTSAVAPGYTITLRTTETTWTTASVGEDTGQIILRRLEGGGFTHIGLMYGKSHRRARIGVRMVNVGNTDWWIDWEGSKPTRFDGFGEYGGVPGYLLNSDRPTIGEWIDESHAIDIVWGTRADYSNNSFVLPITARVGAVLSERCRIIGDIEEDFIQYRAITSARMSNTSFLFGGAFDNGADWEIGVGHGVYYDGDLVISSLTASGYNQHLNTAEPGYAASNDLQRILPVPLYAGRFALVTTVDNGGSPEHRVIVGRYDDREFAMGYIESSVSSGATPDVRLFGGRSSNTDVTSAMRAGRYYGMTYETQREFYDQHNVRNRFISGYSLTTTEIWLFNRGRR